MLLANRMGYFALVLVWSAALLSAQVVTGTISGRVVDTTGAVLPGATLEVRNVETGFSRTIIADAAGRYAARNLPLGSYTVTSRLDGFRTEVRSGVTLTVGREAIVNLQMSVGTVQETVEVTGEAPMVETTNATLSGLVDTTQVSELPLNGRSFDDLALLLPGIVNQPSGPRNPQQGGGNRLASNGSRSDGNAYLLDGTVTNDHSTQGPGSAAEQNLGVEAIREFRVLTHNFSAEYGRNAGAVISVVTKSGTNEFHGSAYEFLRNNVLDARNFFNPGELPPFRRNQFGAAAGGPLLRDRVFFFANYEGLRQRRGLTVIATVPDADARRGIIPGQAEPIPVSPAMQPYLDIWPLPNARNYGNGLGEFVENFSSSATEDYAMERMDFRLGDNDTFYWRYVYNPSEAQTPRTSPTFYDAKVGTNHFVALSQTHVFSPAALNEFRFGFNRTTPATASGPLDLDPSLDFVPGTGFGSIRFSAVTGTDATAITEFGTSAAAPQTLIQNLFQATDSISIVRGAHTIKTGVDFQRIQLNLASGSRTRGEYQFSGLETLLAARARRFRITPVGQFDEFSFSQENGWRRIMFGWFVQDDFQVSPRLTLNLGFRHEFLTAPTEVNGRNASLVDVRNDSVGTIGPPFVPAKANLAPRVGVAWDPTGTGRTSIRGGVGVFHNHLLGRTWYSYGRDAQFGGTFNINNPPFPLGASQGFTISRGANDTIQPNPDTPTMIHYNLEIQRQLTPTVSFRTGYVGSHGYDMAYVAAVNGDIPLIAADGTKYWDGSTSRYNPNFTDITQLRTAGRSNYNGWQMQLQKAMSSGLQLQASYTLAKTLSDSDAISNSQVRTVNPNVMDVDDLDRDYGYSAFDQTHTLVLNGLYRMPWGNMLSSAVARKVLGGWSIASIFSYGSGFPMNIELGYNRSLNNDDNVPERPNLNPGFSNNPIEGVTAGCGPVNPQTGKTLIPAGQELGTPDLWYDPCAFGLPTEGTLGNLARNTVRGPKYYNVDFTLMKTTPLWREGVNLEFRAEFFNLFNNTFFATPVRTVFDEDTEAVAGASGRISETWNQGREIQFGLRLTF